MIMIFKKKSFYLFSLIYFFHFFFLHLSLCIRCFRLLIFRVSPNSVMLVIYISTVVFFSLFVFLFFLSVHFVFLFFFSLYSMLYDDCSFLMTLKQDSFKKIYISDDYFLNFYWHEYICYFLTILSPTSSKLVSSTVISQIRPCNHVFFFFFSRRLFHLFPLVVVNFFGFSSMSLSFISFIDQSLFSPVYFHCLFFFYNPL